MAEQTANARGVWVAAEYRGGEVHPVSYELLAKARELADKLGTEVVCILIGHGCANEAQHMVAHGADRVMVADHEALAVFREDVWGNIVTALAAEEKPEILLAGGTDAGRAYMPMVATRLKTGLVANCMALDVRVDDRTLLATRPAYGGNLMATIVCPQRRPQMATVRPHVLKAASADQSRTGDVRRIDVPSDLLQHNSVRVLESVQERREGPSLAEAEIVVVAGRGIEREENLGLVRQLADVLGGAVGATRPVTDAGWLPHHVQIGQTGVTISPKLYVGCGVSGAVPHTIGILDSDIIVAINKDPHAEIFDLATYGIVGDLKEVLPLLIQRIKEEKGIR